MCMEISASYELANTADLVNSAMKISNQYRSVNSSKSTFYVNESKDKNNNNSNRISESKSASHINRDPFQHNDFDIAKVIKKLEKDNKNTRNFAMKEISMQSMNHNVDLVIHKYIEKV